MRVNLKPTVGANNLEVRISYYTFFWDENHGV